MLRPLLPYAAALLSACLLTLCAFCAPEAHGDEGMWTFDNPPLAQLKERYGFEPTPDWLLHVQRSVVSTGGGTGAFVSADGLVLTNHHVALGQLQKMSTRENDYVRDGFFARTPAEEIPCPDQELVVLWSMENVTARVAAAMAKGTTNEERNRLRNAELARLQQASTKTTGLMTRTVELYQGGEYWLYRYRTYKDVRLVCAPEERMAFYGGDWDNFEFPRHDLDFTIYRVYENGKPLRPEHWLRWSATGAKDGDLTMLAGHPGRTNRLRTTSQLAYERDLERPLRIRMQEMRLAAYQKYAGRGPEQARQAVSALRGLENNLKRERGFLALLRDPQFFATKQAQESELRSRLAANAELASRYGDAWDHVAAAQAVLRERGRSRTLREMGRVSSLADMAGNLVQMAVELEKPNEKRLRDFRDSNLPSLRFRLLSRAPVVREMEEAIFAAHLQVCLDSLGAGDAFVQAALEGRTPAEVARELFAGTRLADVAERQRLLDGGRAAVESSTDPFIVWARRVDVPNREMRRWFEDHVESVEAVEGARIAEARFAVYGHRMAPDATGTLRLSYGQRKGYPELETLVPSQTTFYGLYDRAASFDHQPPFDLPRRVLDAEPRVKLSTPLNFVNTTESVGGSSGSPVLDRKGELVGLTFDGNIHSFLWTFISAEAKSRSVAVDSRAIIEALRNIYGMGALADELERGNR